MRAIAHLAILVLWAGGPCQAQQERLRVGTWNLEHFGGREQPRSAADLDKIAALIRAVEIDVLAVQEIASEQALTRLMAALGNDWRFVLGRSGGFRGGSGRISVGFLWNDARVELLQAEELRQLPQRDGKLPIFHRVPVSAAFRARDGGLDFRAITVHLKASRGTVNEAKRSAEARHLLGYVRELYAREGEDLDVLVLGGSPSVLR